MKEKIPAIIRLLEREYPDRKTALHFSTPFQLVVATILSAQTTDAQVNRVTPSLFKKYKGPKDFAAAPLDDIMAAVNSVNFYRNKARNIKKLAEVLHSDFGDAVPDSLAELVKLPGVARKTANVVLAEGFGKAEGLVVDTHVRRLAQRIGLSRHDDPVKIEADLMKIVPRNKWISFPFTLILHGRNVCLARNPAHERCVINSFCDYYEKFRQTM